MTVEEKSVYKDLVYLVSCAINETPPDQQIVANTDFEKLFLCAKKHSLLTIAATELERAGIVRDDFTQEKWKAIRRELAFNSEREKILSALEKAEIWYLPMKGIVIKDYYPGIGMRQMTDNDILFDSNKEETVISIMLDLGFDLENVNPVNDVFFKKPFFNFEMHKAFYPKDSKRYNYYKTIKEKLLKDSGNSYGYHFSDEDFYIYMIAHEYKHFSEAGTGLRSLLDVFLFLRGKQESLDWNYITGELDKLELTDFENTNRRLAAHLFSGEDADSEELDVLNQILRSGTRGTFGNLLEKLGGGVTGKIRFVIRRIFFPLESVKAFYPVFYKYPLLLPFLPFYRLFCGLADKKRRDNIKKQLTALIKK